MQVKQKGASGATQRLGKLGKEHSEDPALLGHAYSCPLYSAEHVPQLSYFTEQVKRATAGLSSLWIQLEVKNKRVIYIRNGNKSFHHRIIST